MTYLAIYSIIVGSGSLIAVGFVCIALIGKIGADFGACGLDDFNERTADKYDL